VVARDAELSVDVCTEVARLAPFGLGNPAPTLLAPGCLLAQLATVGDGKHLRLRVRREGRDGGSAIAFGQGPRLDALQPEAPYDIAFRLEENRWNGTVAPQLVVRRVFPSAARFGELRDWLVAEFRKPPSSRDAEAERAGGSGWGSGADLRGARAHRSRRPRSKTSPARIASLPRSARYRAAASGRGLNDREVLPAVQREGERAGETEDATAPAEATE